MQTRHYNMGDKIRHTGIVEQQTGRRLTVLITQTSACSSCRLAGHCNASEAKEKRIEALAATDKHYAVGDTVTVSTSLTTGYQAVAVGFGLPLLLMILTLVIIILLTHNETTAALASIAILIPYYIGIYLLRRHIGQRFTFIVE